MMRCPPFAYHAPATVDEAARILRAEGPSAVLIAGGTDVVPGMKRRTLEPRTLVSLRRIGALRGFTPGEARLTIGAGTTLSEVAGAAVVRPYGALWRAAAQVATPHIRHAATVGGNLCLDTRCTYYDQSLEWRQAIGYCMKLEGQVCWVAPGSPRCWAVSSTDLAPALIALGAEVELRSADGPRKLPLADLYRDDGIAYLGKRADEILTEVRLQGATGWRSTYWKLRRREAFDFPVLGVAAAVKLAADGTVEAARLVFGAVASHPVLAEAAERLVGGRLTDDLIAEVADGAFRLAKPLDNTDFHIGWRKRIARAFVSGALRELRGDDPAELGALARRATALRPLA
jgi:4-hydroxybenzoyl-CoA reductase subunit beta